MAEKLSGAAKELRKQELITEIARKRKEIEDLVKQLSEIAPLTATDYAWGLR